MKPIYKRFGVQKQLYFNKQAWEQLQKEMKKQKVKWSSQYVLDLVMKDLKLSPDK